MKVALVLTNNRVGQLVELGQEFSVAPPCAWVECSDDVQVGWLYDADARTFAPPVDFGVEPLVGEAAVQAVSDALFAYLDKVAYEARFRNTLHCISMMSSGDAGTRAKAMAFNAYRDLALGYMFALGEAVYAGQRTQPTPEEAVEEFRTVHPMYWPD